MKVEQITYKVVRYRSAEDALRKYKNLQEPLKMTMATTYQEAFAGPPWYEAHKCPTCGFSGTSTCPTCGTEDLKEAYPKDELVNTIFPEMVSGLSPGCTVLAISNDRGVVGFNNGGISKFDRLLEIKYAPKIKDSILEITGASPDDTVWYENESAVRRNFQRLGIGSNMSQMRMGVMLDLAPDIVCGRTLNPHWLRKRGEHLTEAGYRFDSCVPDGETFQVEGNYRSFYWGIRQTR